MVVLSSRIAMTGRTSAFYENRQESLAWREPAQHSGQTYGQATGRASGTARLFMSVLFLVSLALHCPLSVAQEARRSPDLARSYEDTRNEKNREIFRNQIIGDVSDAMVGLGPVPATSGSAANIQAVLGPAPAGRGWTREALGAKPLPYAEGSSVVWIYFKRDKTDPGSSVGGLFRLALARQNAGKGAAFTLQDGSSLDIELDERESPDRFDFAPYRLGTLGRAFGVRTQMLGCGAGGTLCATEYLTLIAADPELRAVMRAPVSSYVNSAGKWHPDGTRDHYVEELSAVVVVGRLAENSIPLLTVRRLHKGRWMNQVYRPTRSDGANGRLAYETGNPPVVRVVD